MIRYVAPSTATAASRDSGEARTRRIGRASRSVVFMAMPMMAASSRSTRALQRSVQSATSRPEQIAPTTCADMVLLKRGVTEVVT
jgi:hypothetical protein